jgi:VanZ family protein
MDGITATTTPPRQRALWLLWLLGVALWTTALLTTFPVHVKDTVLPPDAGYHAAKTLHVGTYALLAGSAAWLLPGSRFRILPILFLSFHAFATEFLQTFTESRHGCLADVGFNHLGIVLGLLLTGWKWLPLRA